MLAAITLPSINPEIFSIEMGNFRFALRWYAMAYIVGFLVAWLWVVSLMRRPKLWPEQNPPLRSEEPEKLLSWVIVGVVLGGRLGYALFYNPAYYFGNPLELLMVWRGGMSFHGACIGLVTATYLFCRSSGTPILSVSDVIAVTVTPGLFLGRLANFVNGELWGRPSDVPWAVIISDGPGSFCPSTWTAVCARHPSQLYEAALEGLVLGALLAWLAYRRGWLKTPGLIAGTFFIGYGIARIFVELYRVPDAQFISDDNPAGFAVRLTDSIGLTMGQLLSLPMLAVGAIFIALALRKRA